MDCTMCSPVWTIIGKRVPIEYAINAGFLSLVKVLLDGGTEVGPIDGYCPMRLALEKRRLDIVELLVEHGYSPGAVDMQCVLATWDPAIMEFFVAAGCDFEKGSPIAWALCNKIRTALPLVKKYWDKFPSFPEQANIALRQQAPSIRKRPNTPSPVTYASDSKTRA